MRLLRGNQRRLTLCYISDLSFYKFWKRAWKFYERIREERQWGDCPYGWSTCYSKPPFSKGPLGTSPLWVPHTQASCSVPASLVLGLFPLVKKNLWIVFFEKKVYFFQGTNPIRNHFFSLISFPPRDQQKSALRPPNRAARHSDFPESPPHSPAVDSLGYLGYLTQRDRTN